MDHPGCRVGLDGLQFTRTNCTATTSACTAQSPGNGSKPGSGEDPGILADQDGTITGTGLSDLGPSKYIGTILHTHPQYNPNINVNGDADQYGPDCENYATQFYPVFNLV